MSEPVYCGTGTIKNGPHGQFLALAFSAEDVQKMQNNLNQKGWINVNVSKRKNQIQGKPTHSLVINFWQPENQGGQQGGNQGGQGYQNQGPPQNQGYANQGGQPPQNQGPPQGGQDDGSGPLPF